MLIFHTHVDFPHACGVLHVTHGLQDTHTCEMCCQYACTPHVSCGNNVCSITFHVSCTVASSCTWQAHVHVYYKQSSNRVKWCKHDFYSITVWNCHEWIIHIDVLDGVNKMLMRFVYYFHFFSRHPGHYFYLVCLIYPVWCQSAHVSCTCVNHTIPY